MKKQLLIICFAFTTLLGITACNTVEGFGKDVEAGGEAIEDAADD